MKAINVQTLFHQELPDCYVFAVAVSIRVAPHFSPKRKISFTPQRL